MVSCSCKAKVGWPTKQSLRSRKGRTYTLWRSKSKQKKHHTLWGARSRKGRTTRYGVQAQGGATPFLAGGIGEKKQRRRR